MSESFTTRVVSGVLSFDDKALNWGKSISTQRLSAVRSKNVYIDMNGQIRPKKFPIEGMWMYDGQIFYLPKSESLNV